MRAIVILRRRLIRAWSLRAEQLRCVSKLRAHTAPVCVLLCAEKSGLLISASDDARWIVRTRGRAGALQRTAQSHNNVLRVAASHFGSWTMCLRSPREKRSFVLGTGRAYTTVLLACRRRATPPPTAWANRVPVESELQVRCVTWRPKPPTSWSRVLRSLALARFARR